MQRSDTSFRNSLKPEIQLAAFLLWAGGQIYAKLGSKLGTGASTVRQCVKEVSSMITERMVGAVRLPYEETHVATVMRGFQSISDLPYCVGAIDDTHIPWKICCDSQYYEYRCYKGYTSIVLFAVADSKRRFMYAESGHPGVMGDATIYNCSKLKRLIESDQCLGPEIASLRIGTVHIRPYLIGDCAFNLGKNVMKTATVRQLIGNADIRMWEKHATKARKPIECAFGILKNRFPVLSSGILLHHEDEAARAIMACVILYNLCIDATDIGEEFLEPDLNLQYDDENVGNESSIGQRTRSAVI